MKQATISINNVFKAFADDTRLRILAMLKQQKELCVCDIKDALGHGQPKVSRHLATLRRAGLVGTRREGTWIYYFLAPSARPFHKQLLACLGSCFGEIPALKQDARRVRAAVKARKCC